MKKIYALVVGLMSVAAVAQTNDLAVDLDNYTSGSTQTDDPVLCN